MKTIMLAVLLLGSVTILGQSKELSVTHTDLVLGRSSLTDTDIHGTKHTFPDRIHELFLDTTSGLLTLQIRGLTKNGKWMDNKGKIIQYDLHSNAILWHKTIVFASNYLQQFSHTMIYTVQGKSSFLDARTGNALWQVRNSIYCVDPIANIGVGYKLGNSLAPSDQLEGIDLSTGKVIWTRKLSREFGWNNIYRTNDSTLMIVAAGLHSMNIRTGQGWDYTTVTGKKDYSGTVAANVAGAALGILTGAFVTSTGHDLVRDLVSNSLLDSTSIYISSLEQLVKVDRSTGAIIWNSPFPKELPSSSNIYMDDSTIYMTNKGSAYMGYRKLDFGQPFIAAFDRGTGDRKYLSILSEKDGPILGSQLLNDELYLVFKNRIAKYSEDRGSLIADKKFQDGDEEFKYFAGDQLYIRSEPNVYSSLPETDSTKVFVYTTEGNVLVINNSLEVTDTIKPDALNVF
ncbi:MAG: PQQ-binding-like beta-propeller repeat protein, partial [Flavobacteriales bacterium]